MNGLSQTVKKENLFFFVEMVKGRWFKSQTSTISKFDNGAVDEEERRREKYKISFIILQQKDDYDDKRHSVMSFSNFSFLPRHVPTCDESRHSRITSSIRTEQS